MSISGNLSHRAMTYKKPYNNNNNKLFNYNLKFICSGGSILEEFFSSCRKPAVNTTILYIELYIYFFITKKSVLFKAFLFTLIKISINKNTNFYFNNKKVCVVKLNIISL